MIKGLLLAFLITRFEVIHKWAENIIDNSNSTVLSIIANLLHNKLTTCIKCAAFWIILIMTGNIYISILGHILAFIYDKCFSQWETRTKLF